MLIQNVFKLHICVFYRSRSQSRAEVSSSRVPEPTGAGANPGGQRVPGINLNTSTASYNTETDFHPLQLSPVRQGQEGVNGMPNGVSPQGATGDQFIGQLPPPPAFYQDPSSPRGGGQQLPYGYQYGQQHNQQPQQQNVTPRKNNSVGGRSSAVLRQNTSYAEDVQLNHYRG